MQQQNPIIVLTQGVSAWNHWRQEQQKSSASPLAGQDIFRINLREKLLIRAQLPDINLSYVDGCMINLAGANLQRANLREVIFYTANLCQARLSYANLL
ncbi:MAG: pentapeptide repeat-containing protein, partial [Cyanobacteria bacterium P01_A01_bin.114]